MSPTITTRQERPLGLLEKYQTSKHLTHAYGNISLTFVLKHEEQEETAATFYLSHFQPALAHLIQSHPNLSVVVQKKDKSSVHFQQLTTIDLAQVIQVVNVNNKQQQDDISLQALVKEQVSQEFDLDALLPLWRLKVVPTSSTSCIVALGMHHTIGDGMSLTIFLQDFLQVLNGDGTAAAAASAKEIDTKPFIIQVKETLTMAPPYELSNAPKLSLMMDVVPVLAKNLIPKILPAAAARLLFATFDGWKGDFPAIDGEAHKTEVQLIHVVQAIWRPITMECKKRGISAHAILYVSLLLAWQQLYQDVVATEVATPINCRGLCNPPVSKHQIGNYVGAYTSYYWTAVANNRNDIWQMAQKYHQDLQTNKVTAAKQTLFLKYLSEYPASYYDFWFHKRRSSNMGRTGGIELSDLGKFNGGTSKEEEEYGCWKLNDVYFCQSAQVFTVALGMNSITYNDELYCTINWQKGALDTSKMSLYHDKFIAVLKDLLIS